ncbi:ARM repeat-containing protein [Hyphopichia burtonii NRRL Y-1933]|uniref:ARM repeat-containing protein n=1 Tax=Hyphopichia burtonii NRRL Y-1933 TaxID=984485 RepID=A0A1E4RMS5_9ASCO|nr:ARM repeat-containing protein [Hyphopichia burtonii NRRL Y-1933]ODV68491.1 ARM repeat-containing protein [Hyphopichia burtonii NRRL Y-1933]
MSLNYNDVLNVLAVANESERNGKQQEAESQLKSWEIQPGYHYILQDIYLNTELPLQMRWLAIICFKNGIEKYWRASRQNSIKKEEKEQIKSRLFQLLSEKNNQLTIQNAHSVARIVRFDFPGDWPTLFDEISNNLEDFVFNKNDLIATNNLLIILNQIIKAVAVVRIGRARHAMQSKAPILVPVLFKLYSKFFQIWTSSLDLTIMEICYLCLKNLRRIIPEGFEQPHKNHDIVEFLKVSVSHLQGLVMEHEKYSSDLLERYVKSYSKLYVNLINSNPTSFILLPCSQDIMTTFLTLLEQKAEVIYESTEDNDFWEVLAIKGLIILKRLMTYIYKKGAITLKQRNDREEVTHAITKLSKEFFTPQVVQHLCDLIINWYLRLRPSDLEGWLLEPEEWCNEELSTSWEYQVRPCAENFYQDLIRFFKDELSDFILNKISNGISNSMDILVKDATLCTFQLSATSISNNVNFGRLLSEVFIPEGLKNDSPENKIIKRRICLIINEWVPVDCSRESRVDIYKLLINFLQPDNKVNDKVVKLTSIQTLRNVVQDWDFNKQDFQPFLKEFVSLSLNLLSQMSFTESKLYVLDTLATLIEKCNPLIDYQTLMSILSIIPGHWDETNVNNEEAILRASLLRILKNLVVALNENSPETHVITLPLVKNCVSSNSDLYTLLSEDGCDLWLSILQYLPMNQAASASANELMSLFDLVHYCLVNSTEILPTILSIVRSYALINPNLFNENAGLEMLRTLSGYISSMRDDSFAIFIALMDILFLAKADDEAFVTNLINSGLFSEMVNFVLDENQSIVTANKILLILSRLAYKSSEMFLKMLSHLSIDTNKFFDIWLRYYNNNGNPRNKKINIMALLAIAAYGVPLNFSPLPAKFSEILKLSFMFLEEVQENSDGFCSLYSQNLVYEDIDDYQYLDQDIKPHGEKIRYQSLLESNDPLYKVNLQEFVKQVSLKLKQDLSDSDFASLMSMNDQYTSECLQKLA